MTEAATPAAPPSASVRRTLFSLLRLVEDGSLTGVMHMTGSDGAPLGRVMVARGRLGFCAPAAAQARIGDLLVGDDPAFRTRIDEAAREARRRKLRLCEALLQDGRFGLDVLRGGLLHQTTRGLLVMCGQGAAAAPRYDFSPARDDYDHRLTFSPLEIFVQCSALLDSAPQDRALRLFSEYADAAEAALLLMKPATQGGPPLPVAVRGLDQASLDDVASLAHCAAEMLRPSAFARAAVPVDVVAYQGPGGVWVAANGSERLALLRTSPRSEAQQVVDSALRLARGG